MGRKIAIIGAGQSGLQTGIGLLQKGYQVSMYSNRSPEQIKNGKVMSSQCMFDNALQNERDLGINFWENSTPKVEGLGVNLVNPELNGEKVFGWVGKLNNYAQSTDQRMKMPRWIEEFEKLGGQFIIQDVGVPELEEIAKKNELVIVAAGKGEIVKIFERDAEKSVYDKPMRALALTYVNGMVPNKPFCRVSFNLIPNVGEYFVYPCETLTGSCEVMVFEGIPGGPMDCWSDVKTPEEHLEKSLWILKTFIPWEYERCKNVTLTDDNGILSGRYPPTIRKPIATLPSGAKILGIADVVVLNDPLTGQGSNSASKCSKVYLDAIIEHGNKPYDTRWMQETFDKYWEVAQYVSLWTNSLLGSHPPHLLGLLTAASQHQSIADLFANNFNDPTQFFPWWLDSEKTSELIASHTEV